MTASFSLRPSSACRIRWSWSSGLQSWSCCMTSYEALMQLLVMQRVHGYADDKRLRLEFEDTGCVHQFDSMGEAIACLDVCEKGLVQWMWGDAVLPTAHLNPFRWSEKLDAQSTAQQMRSYLGGADALRRVRVRMTEKTFPTLKEAIAVLEERS